MVIYIAPDRGQEFMAMHYVRKGSGDQAILALHGWMGSHLSFSPLLDRVPASHSLYTCDLPGYGKSPLPEDPNVPNLVSPLSKASHEILAFGDHPSLTILGSCSGALLAFYLAQDLGPKVKRLVLLDPFPALPWYLQVFGAGVFGRTCYRLAFDFPLGQKIAAKFLPQRKPVASELETAIRGVESKTALAYLNAFKQRNPVHDIVNFSNLDCQIDFIFGSHSFAAVRKGIEIWENAFPEANIIEIPNTGHFLLEEATDEVHDILYSFGEPESLEPRATLDAIRGLTPGLRRLTLKGKGESSCSANAPASLL